MIKSLYCSNFNPQSSVNFSLKSRSEILFLAERRNFSSPCAHGHSGKMSLAWISSWPSLYDTVLAPRYGLDKLSSYPYMSVEIMAGSLVFYLAVTYFTWPSPQDKVIKTKGIAKFGIFSHNFFLMLYSILIFYETFPILTQCVVKHDSLYEAV
jgi:hypothetical protein